MTPLLLLRVQCPCSPRTYATLKCVRSSSSSSSVCNSGAKIFFQSMTGGHSPMSPLWLRPCSQNFGWVGHNAFGPTIINWSVCSLILHCGQLILRKISKIGASRYQILRLKCTKFTFCWGSPQTPAGGAYSAPISLPLFKGPTSKGMEGKRERGRKCKREERGQVEGGIWPTQKFWCGAPYEITGKLTYRTGYRQSVTSCNGSEIQVQVTSSSSTYLWLQVS